MAAALGAGEQMVETLSGTSAQRLKNPPPAEVMQQLQKGLSTGVSDRAAAEQSVRLAEAIRVLALKHGPPALDHCLRLVEQIRALLDQVTEGAHG